MLETIEKFKNQLIPRVISKLPSHIQKLFNDGILIILTTGKFAIDGTVILD